MKIVVATNNEHKLKEIRDAYSGVPVIFLSLNDVGIQVDPIENGETYLENAIIKASAVAKLTDLPVLADDSGIEIEELGEHTPGIFTSRFAKSNGGQEATNKMLVKKVPNSKARFICDLALLNVVPNEVVHFEGLFEGKISEMIEGEKGFGYDPIFIPVGYEHTVATLPEDIKNKISHRGQALKKLYEFLNKGGYLN